VSELLEDVSELLRGRSFIEQNTVEAIAGVALLISSGVLVAEMIAPGKSISLGRVLVIVGSLIIFCVSAYILRVALKTIIYHCLTVFFYVAGTAFYFFAGGSVLWWLYLIWTSIVSFLTAPIGIKSDSSPDDGLKWVLFLSTLGSYILWKIVKHVRINSKSSLLPPTTGVPPPPVLSK
jgi:hypothetical protein